MITSWVVALCSSNVELSLGEAVDLVVSLLTL